LLSVKDLFDIAHVRHTKGSVMLLKAYLDESRHTDGPVCAVAGFAGTEEEWGTFEPDWLRAIAPRKSLHMTELRRNTKPDRLKRLLDRAGAIPDKHSLRRVASTVRRQDYLDIVAGTDLDAVLDPYMGCFLLCLKAVLERIGQDNQLHVFLEEQERYAPRVNFYYEQVFRMRKADARLVGVTFLGKNEAVGFQAADYLAFHIAKHKADPADPKAVLTRPISGRVGVGWNMTRQDMAGLANRIAADWRAIDERERVLREQ
jgi:hypothetical protein